MRVPYHWLQEYVNIKMPPQALAELLTMSGLSVESVREVNGDHLIEVEVTSNRPDALSLIGIAREVSALTGGRLKIPKTQDTRHKTHDTRRWKESAGHFYFHRR